jgi:predicted Zn-dependent peptidase
MQATQLPNGIRVVSEESPDLGSVTVGIWVENGSRYEIPAQAGISHFLEHLFFKGTVRRTAAQIAEEIDAVGGVLNAFTGKEYTCYYAKVLDEHLPLALDVLGDVFTHSRFAEEEIERERSVILQEISQIEDNPDDYVHDLFTQAFWGDHALARPIAGTPATVGGLHRDDFVRFLGAQYTPDRILVAGAGNLRHEDLIEVVQAQLGPLAGAGSIRSLAPPTPTAGVAVHEKDLEQVHMCVGSPGIAQSDEDRYAAHLLSLALGGGMSSRLFQEIRERQGKAYSVYSFLTSYRDSGYLGIYAGTSAAWAREVLRSIRNEVARVVRDGLTAAELGRAKTQMKGSMLLGLETSDSRMTRIAKNEIYSGRDVPVAEVAAAFDAVTNDDIVRVAQRLFGGDLMQVTLLGPLDGAAVDEGVLAE